MSDITPSTSDIPATGRASTRYAYYVFWIMFIISFLNSLDRYVLAGAAKTVAQELGFGPEGFGFISSALVIVYTLCSVRLGIWADRTARKTVVAFLVVTRSLTSALA